MEVRHELGQRRRRFRAPGSIIYRNSSPRLIRLLGLGEEGGKVARKVAKRGLPNVEVLTDAKPVGWNDIADDGAGARPT